MLKFFFQVRKPSYNYDFKPIKSSNIKIIGTINLSPASKRKAINLFLINNSPLTFKNQPAIIHTKKAFIGIKQFDVIKSRKSKMFLPRILKFFNSPNDNVAGIDITEIMKNKYVQALFFDIFNFSIIDAIGTSRILIPEVTDAANNKIKNEKDTIFPCGI